MRQAVTFLLWHCLGQGVKMSKSVGNVTDPRMVIEGGKDLTADPAYGADVLRLWVASVDFTADVLIGSKILAQACTFPCSCHPCLSAERLHAILCIWQIERGQS